MKKISSFVLMAVMLLMSANTWAANTISVVYHNGKTAPASFSDLQTAINSVAPGDSATITLSATQLLSKGIVIPNVMSAGTDAEKVANRKPQHICIDLNGCDIKTLSSTPHAVISLVKGVLRITGEGRIERANVAKGGTANGGNWSRGAIVVSGTDGRDASLITEAKPDRSKQEWSVLYIDENVEVFSEYEDTYGIGIQEIGPNLPSWGVSSAALGYATYYKGTTASGPEESAPMWTKKLVHPKKGDDYTTQYSAFGVKVIVAGTVYGHTRGINVVGNINQTPKDAEGHTARTKAVYPYYDRNYPYIQIKSTAEVYCQAEGIEDNGNGGLYIGGWVMVDISGAVHGQTGIMLKAGDLKVTDGKVYSDASAAVNDGNYHGTVSGSGIFVTSDAAYSGQSSVTVEGDSYIAGDGGSAIIDVLASNATETQVSHVTITGGTIEGGSEGAINITTGTQDQTEVTGGGVTGPVSVTNTQTGITTQVDVTNLVPNTTEYHTTTITTTDEEGNKTTTVVVSQGAKPTGDDFVAKDHDASSSVKWTGTSELIESNVELKELLINEDKIQTLTIKSGYSLTAGRVMLGDNARVIVEPGAKFLVTGNQGITAYQSKNIVLQTNNTAQAWFLVNPSVISNRHPLAKVELYSEAYSKGGGEYVWQRFGVPAFSKDEVTFEDINKDYSAYGGTSYKSNFKQLVNGSWETVPAANWATEYLVPFTAYSVTTTAPADGVVYTFECSLVGNSNATLPLTDKWNYYANSYTAPIRVSNVVNDFANDFQHISGTVYLYEPAADDWFPVNNATQYTRPEYPTVIKPMHAFAIHRRNSGDNPVVNYEKEVYNPAIAGLSSAPARANEVPFSTAVVEIVAADGTKDEVALLEGEQFSAEYDNAYDAEKMMKTERTCIYAEGVDEKLGIIATDNLEGTILSLDAKEQTSFVMTVRNVNDMNYAIRDMLTGTEVELAEGATYMFTVPANTTVNGRFKVVGLHKVPTAIENIEEVAATKGIYNMAGQYMGNDFHTLSAGVYVVDGKKVVK